MIYFLLVECAGTWKISPANPAKKYFRNDLVVENATDS